MYVLVRVRLRLLVFPLRAIPDRSVTSLFQTTDITPGPPALECLPFGRRPGPPVL